MRTPAPSEPDRVAGRVFALLRAYKRVAERGWVFDAGTPFRCFPAFPERVERPDAAFVAFARTPAVVYGDEGHCLTVPDVAVEVVAPEDRAYAHADKVASWLSAGVRLVWELFPTTRTVYVTRPDGTALRLRAADTLTADGVLPGFACPVADLFRLPGEPAAGS